jgi:hypothetical protein
LIVCGDLVDAVREEYGAAVAAHWGAVREKVWRWRRVLGVSLYAGGTHALMQDTVPEKVNLARLTKARAASRTPWALA